MVEVEKSCGDLPEGAYFGPSDWPDRGEDGSVRLNKEAADTLAFTLVTLLDYVDRCK